MLKTLRKRMVNDIYQIRLNDESIKFSNLVRDLTKRVNLSNSGKKMIFKHLERYLRACEKDTKLRTPKMVSSGIDFVDLKEKENHVFTKKEVQMLRLIDYFDIRNQYGSWASSLYIKMNERQQKRMLEVLDNIQEMNISDNEKEFRRRKYLLTCSTNQENKKQNKFSK